MATPEIGTRPAQRSARGAPHSSGGDPVIVELLQLAVDALIVFACVFAVFLIVLCAGGVYLRWSVRRETERRHAREREALAPRSAPKRYAAIGGVDRDLHRRGH